MGNKPLLRLVHTPYTDDSRLVPGDTLESWTIWMQSAGLAARTIQGRVETVRLLSRRMGVDPVTTGWEPIAGFLAGLNPGTQQNYRSSLRSWFQWLNQVGLRTDDPMARLHRGRPVRRKPRPLDQEQVAALLNADIHARTLPMILLGLYEGFRVMEIAKFKGSDIHGDMVGVVGKGGTYDEVPLHPAVASAALWMPATGDWFPSYLRPGDPITANSTSHILSMVMRRAGIQRPLTPHSLRHTFGTDLLKSTGNLALVQRLMRHTNIASTVVYTDVDLDQRRAAISSLRPPNVRAA